MKKYAAYQPSGVEWLGDVPAHWEVKRLKFVLEGIEQGWSPQCDNQPAAAGEWGVLKVGCVNGHEFEPMENKRLPDDLEPLFKYEIHEGDVLMSRANTKELVGSTAIVRQLPTRLMLCDKLYRLQVPKTVKKEFLVYMLRSQVARVQYEQGASGASGSMQNIGQDTVQNLELVWPPLHEQRAIAAFLDARTAHLDGLIRRKEDLLKLLAEQRAALITRAVTRGLDASTPLHDSGVPWLGQVPKHWAVKRLKFITSKTGSGKTPKGGADVYVSEGVTFLRSQNIHFDGLELSDVAYIEPEVDEEMSSTRVKAGDVLLNITGASLGRVAMAGPELGPANVNQHVCILRPNQQQIESIFLWKYLASPAGQSQVFQNEQGISRDALNFEQIDNLWICVPPLAEQAAIVAHLVKIEGPLLKMRDITHREIAKLREYRAALITAAVTGRIDVRKTVPEAALAEA